MINRKPLDCDACATRVIVRTQIGHADEQVHSFACPGCGVPITYQVLLDQESAGIKYCEKPDNATWVDSEDGALHSATFDPEYLIHKDILISAIDLGLGPTSAFPLPFLMTHSYFEDIGNFQAHEAWRLHWRKEYWPVVRRLPVHFENQNWNKLVSEAESIGMQPDDESAWGALDLLVRTYVLSFSAMLYAEGNRTERIAQRIVLARSVSPELYRELATAYRDTGRMRDLWRQLQDFHAAFVNRFRFLSPLLQPARYWKEPAANLNDYVVCDKRFAELKSLYVDSFETFARLSVIAVGIESIIHHRALHFPTRKGTMDLWEFEKLKNANKPDHLRKYPIDDLFSPYLDATIRNGIGHNSSRYDGRDDAVVCVRQFGARTTESKIHYTEFCHRVLELSSVLFHTEPYFFALLAECGGVLS